MPVDRINSKKNLLSLLKDKRTWKAIFITVFSALLIAFILFITPPTTKFFAVLLKINSRVDSLEVRLPDKANKIWVNDQINNVVNENEKVLTTMVTMFTEYNKTNTKEHIIMINTLNTQCKNDSERNKLLQELLDSKKESKLVKDSLRNDIYINSHYNKFLMQPDSCIQVVGIQCINKDSLTLTKNQ